MLFARLGMPTAFINVLRGLHDGTCYQVMSKQGLSDPYRLSRGFREGCCSSPGCYSIFHDSCMQHFRRTAFDFLQQLGTSPVRLGYDFGRPFHKRKYKPKGEMKHRPLLDITFADDTSLICRVSTQEPLEQLLDKT